MFDHKQITRNDSRPQAKNYVKLNDFSILNLHYVYFDKAEHLADQIFIRNRLRVYFEKDYENSAKSYNVVFCHVRKKDEEVFLKSMDELQNKMSEWTLV